MTGHKKESIKIPKTFKPEIKRWIKEIMDSYYLESHHIKLLLLAGSALQRCEEARKSIERHGTIFTDKFGQPRIRPELAVERDSRIAFCRCLRELNLDSEEMPESRRPPKLKY